MVKSYVGWKVVGEKEQQSIIKTSAHSNRLVGVSLGAGFCVMHWNGDHLETLLKIGFLEVAVTISIAD